MPSTYGWTVAEWRTAYANGTRPEDLVFELRAHLNTDNPEWISILPEKRLADALDHLAQLKAEHGEAALSLYGVPFAVKDNIDVAGLETTAACPAFARVAVNDAAAVARLRAAGAIPIGKTNLDQFATGLVGTRSPYGAVANSFDGDYISGGSSSGSATVVAGGAVPFSLGTDTAGSGRVPAGFNNLVGLKPTRGAISTLGVVPACRSLDCVSVFGLTLADVTRVYQVVNSYNADDPQSRKEPLVLPDNTPTIRRSGPIRRLGIPADPEWFGDNAQAAAWQKAVDQWQALDVKLVPIDFSVLFELAALLYDGPWVAERYAAIESLMSAQPDALNPVVRGIIEKATAFTAVDTFNAHYQKEALLRRIESLLDDIDALLVPTTPRFPTQQQVATDPVTVNSQLGTYTNFVNLADLSALAVPAGFRDDGLPFGVTLITGAWKENELATLAVSWMNQHPTPLGATGRERPGEVSQLSAAISPDRITVAVVGAHLSGMPLNPQLTDRHAELEEETTTAPRYRLFALPGTTPPKPGLSRVNGNHAESGAALTVELWSMPAAAFGSFVALVPPPLGIGNVELADGRWVKGFICEDYGLDGAEDVTAFGGWRAYMKSLTTGS